MQAYYAVLCMRSFLFAINFESPVLMSTAIHVRTLVVSNAPTTYVMPSRIRVSHFRHRVHRGRHRAYTLAGCQCCGQCSPSVVSAYSLIRHVER